MLLILIVKRVLECDDAQEASAVTVADMIAPSPSPTLSFLEARVDVLCG